MNEVKQIKEVKTLIQMFMNLKCDILLSLKQCWSRTKHSRVLFSDIS